MSRADAATTPRRRLARALGPTAVSLLLHGVVLPALLIVTLAPPPADAVGPAIHMTFLPDLGEMVADEAFDTPIVEELEEVDVPELEEMLVLEAPLPPEEEVEILEALDEIAEATERLDLPLTVAQRRTRPEPRPLIEAPRIRPPTARKAVALRLAPTPPIRHAAPMPRQRSAPTGGRLRPLSTPIHYPEDARRRGIQGVAKIEMIIRPDGTIHRVRLAASSGHSVLDRAALASARQWRFAPPNAPRRVIQPFRFSMG